MRNNPPTFEDKALQSALKRTTLASGASHDGKARIASLLLSSAPGTAGNVSPGKPPLKISPRVFGLPRNVGLAAALALLLAGGGMIYTQLREFFPAREHVAVVDRMRVMIDALVSIHGHVPPPEKLSSDLIAFQKELPSSMPLATLRDINAKFQSACVEELDGQICYAIRYELDGKPFTLVTGAGRMYYEIPKYNQVENNVRLVGGERESYLVCLMGDSSIPEATFQTLFANVKMLPSPSTQPVSSVVVNGPCSLSN